MSVKTFELDHLVRINEGVRTCIPALNDTVRGILFKACHEVSASVTKTCEPFKIIVASVKDNDVSFFQRNQGRYFLFMDFTGCHTHKIWQVT